jgi:hypothetical protein
MTVLNIELDAIVTHSLSVLNKINMQVGGLSSVPDAKFKSYQIVWPYTLSLPLLASWDQVVAEFPLNSQDVASVLEQLRKLIEAHASDK